MAGGNNTSTFVITADARQAIRTFQDVARAAQDAQRVSASGSKASSQSFFTGQFKERDAEAKAYLKDLEAIQQATAKLQRGQQLPAGVISGFKGGTAAQAVEFAGTTRQTNLAQSIAARGANMNVPAADTEKYIRDVIAGFQQAFGGYSRNVVARLEQQFGQAAAGSPSEVGLGRFNDIMREVADMQQRVASNTLQAMTTAAQTAQATKNAVNQAAATAGGGKLLLLRPGGPPVSGPAGNGAQQSRVSGPYLTYRDPVSQLSPAEVEDKILKEAYAKNIEYDRKRGQLVTRAEAEMQAAFDKTSQAARAENRRADAASLRDPNGDARAGTYKFGNLTVDTNAVDENGKKVLDLYKHVGDGAEKLARGSEEYFAAKEKIIANLARQGGGGGIGGAVYEGLASGGFGGGGKDGLINGLVRSGVTTAKYAALATVLYSISGAAAEAFKQFLDFDDSVTELEVALGQSESDIRGSSTLLNDLADSASQAGSNVGEAMDVAASAIRAYANDSTNAFGTSEQGLKDLGDEFAQQASRIAILTKTTLTDASGNLKAISAGFDTQNFSRITDAIANAKLVGGGDEKQIGQGLANLAVSAHDAGFGLEEVSNLISDIQAKTDQSGQLIATRLTRGFQLVSGDAGQKAIRDLNSQNYAVPLGPNVTTREQLSALSKIYNGLDEAQQRSLSVKLGGTANSREVGLLLKDFQELSNPSKTQSAGKGIAEYEKRLTNIRNLLQQIGGNLKNFIAALANSGIATPLGIMLEALNGSLKAVREVAQLLGAIPEPLKEAAAILVGILATMKAIQLVSAIRSNADPARGIGGIRGTLEKVQDAYSPGTAYHRDLLRNQQDILLQEPGAAGDLAREAAQRNAAVQALRQQRLTRFNPGNDIDFTAIKDNARQLGGTLKSGLKETTVTVRDYFTRATSEFKQSRLNGGGLLASAGAFGGTAFRAGDQAGYQGIGARLRGIPGAIGQGINGEGGLRDQVNSIGYLGAAGLAVGGIAAVTQILESEKAMRKAVDTYKKLADVALPDNFGVQDLNDSAANLKSAAADLSTASQGFIAGLQNYLEGDPVGLGVREGNQQAAYQTGLASQLQTQIDATNKRNAGDLSTTIDYSSADALTTSITGIQQSGRGATDTMLAFQSALKHIRTTASDASYALNAVDITRIAGATGNDAITAYNNLRPADKSLQSLEGGGFQNAEGAARQTLFGHARSNAPGFLKYVLSNSTERKDYKTLDAYANVDDQALGTATQGVIQGALTADPNALTTPKGLQGVRDQLAKVYADQLHLPAGQIRSDLINRVIFNAQQETKKVTSVTDTTASYGDLAAAIPDLASAYASSFANRSVVEGLYQGQSTGLTQAQQYLDQMQEGYDTLKQKAAENGQDNTPELKDQADKINAAKIEVANQTLSNMDAQFNLLEASKPSESTTDRLNDKLTELNNKLLTPNLTPDQITEINTEIATTKAQKGQSKIADTFAAKDANIDSRDTIAEDQNALGLAAKQRDDYKSRGVTGKALSDAQKAVNDAKLKLAQDQRQEALDEKIAAAPVGSSLQDALNNLNSAKNAVKNDLKGTDQYWKDKRAEDEAKFAYANLEIDLATATSQDSLDPNSALDQAKSALIAATAELSKYKQGTIEWVKAHIAFTAAALAEAKASRDAAGLVRQLGLDLSNPIQTAKEETRRAKEELDAAIKRGASADDINTLTIDYRQKQLAQDKTMFDTFMTNVQNAEQLGDISHKAYLNLLQGRLTQLQAELALLDPNSNGYKQIQDQITQLRIAIKSGADTLDGMFNLGNITVPTPYEVRRAIKASDVGQILSGNGSGSLAGNVVTDNSSRNIIMNGVNLQQVSALISDLFGLKVKSGTTTRV